MLVDGFEQGNLCELYSRTLGDLVRADEDTDPSTDPSLVLVLPSLPGEALPLESPPLTSLHARHSRWH